MKTNQTPIALHIFWDFAPHLSQQFARLIKEYFPKHQIALYKTKKNDGRFDEPNRMVVETASDKFFGILKQSWMCNVKLPFVRLKMIFARICLELSLTSFWRLLMGPKHIILHGRFTGEFNLFTLFCLKLFGKKIYLIHWGGRPSFGRFLGVIDRLTYRLFSHIFVLMSPEIAYFKPFMGDKVSCLPYPHTPLKSNKILISAMQNPLKILIGNSAHYRESYREILDQLNPTEWDKITCMLNYGDEHSANQTDEFVAKYHAKFGDRFFPWRETLPLQQYLQVMEESAFYICIIEHQTGLGAISNSIRQGKTIILRGDNLKWMQSLGVKVFDYSELPDFSSATLQKLRLTPEEAQISYDNFNKNAVQKYTRTYWAQQIKEALSH